MQALHVVFAAESTRRQNPVMFSQPDVAILGLLLLICLRANAADEPGDNRATFLILGAGPSGLQAARTLHDSGTDDFIVLEAADRTGGRVHSAPFGGYMVPLGAAWAAPGDARSAEITRRIDLGYHVTNYDSWAVRNATGHDVTDEADASYERLAGGIDKIVELSARLKLNDAIPDMSQRSGLRIGGWTPRSAVDDAVEWFEYDSLYAEAPDVSSAETTVQGYGDDLFVTDQRGFEHIFDDVAGFLQKPQFANHLRLNQTVVAIDYGRNSSAVVTCEDGTEYIADYVLITFSIGVLQSDLIQFIPPLPEWKNSEIQKFHMAAYTSIFLSYPSKFWDDAEWLLYASEKRGYYPVFLNFQAEGMFPNGSPLIMGIVVDAESRRIEAQPTETTKAEVHQVLRVMYGDGIPEPSDILVTRWSQNPLTLGSYSNIPAETTTACREKVRSRLGRLFFGGEATSDLLFGYVAGALEAGEREARKMLRCLGDPDSDCPGFEVEGDALECGQARAAAGLLPRGNLPFILCLLVLTALRVLVP